MEEVKDILVTFFLFVTETEIEAAAKLLLSLCPPTFHWKDDIIK